MQALNIAFKFYLFVSAFHGGGWHQKVGLKNLAFFLKGFFGFGLGGKVTECMLENIAFECYLFGSMFGGGG